MPIHSVALACLAVLSAAVAGLDDCEAPGNQLLQSSAQKRRADGADKYHWQSGRGNFPNFGVSEENAPFLLNETLHWSWHHPEGRFHTLTWGTAIDHQLNIYLSAADGLRKFDKDGKVLWEHQTLPATLMNAPALYQGAIFASDTQGGLRSLDMNTGKLLWSVDTGKPIGEDNGFTMAHEGVVFFAADHRQPSPMGSANHQIRAHNVSNGDLLWIYEPDAPVWNFLPLFPDRDTLVFQDMTGKAYRMTMKGEVSWKNGGKPGTWTDGSGALGHGMVFVVNNNHPPHDRKTSRGTAGREHEPGTLSAYDLDGNLKWQTTTPRPPNNAPAIGKIQGWSGLSVVMPLCQQVELGATCDVHAYDAESGRLRWQFNGPTQTGLFQAGDLEGAFERTLSGVRPTCLPNGWSAPTIAADGTVFLGNEEGPIFAPRDLDGDGRVFGEDEVSSYDTKAAFSGTASPAIAPNMLAVASCDSLFVFKGQS